MVRVTHITANGFWILIGDAEHFVSFEDFPWFRQATVGQILNVELPSKHHLYWPDLDIDLAVDSIRHPDRFPLVSRAEVAKAPRRATGAGRVRDQSRLPRRPTHPGRMLAADFMTDCGLTVTALAEAVGVSRQSINELLRGRRAVSPEMALRLGRFFGNSPEFWLNAQRAVDLWDAAQTIKGEIARIKPLKVA